VVLAVGDQAFQERCLERLRAFHAAGGTLVVVTHDLQLAGDLCARAVWLEHGRVRLQGEAGQVLAAYRASSAQG
jgi:ABC-2 type transport system ATP-binding protein